MSGDLAWGETVDSVLEEDCMYQLEKNSSVAVVVSDVKAELCPQNCNNNGKCVDGKLYVLRGDQICQF